MRCPSCGKENPEGFRFCGFCTAPLTSATTPSPEERKVVTVLFCDLVGFTAASEDADPEDVRARIDPYFARLTASLVAYGGTVEKFIGDAVMAVFGAPVAHEDDPERAVRAALRILEEIADLNDADPTLDLTVRIGVHTGEVLVRLGSPEESKGLVTGDVVNTASRLQGVAPEGGIVVSEATFGATERIFEYRGMDPVTVKGKSAPLPIWQAVASRSRFGTDLTRTLTTPLVGRDLETRLLRDLFERSVRDRSVQLLTIVGEPGVGKSRLVAELFSHIQTQPDLVRWRQGRCLPYGEGVTFWALGEIVKAEAGILETDGPDVAGAKVDAVVPDDDPDAPWLRQRLRPLVGLDAPQAAREENFTAWRRFLESLADRGPCVLVFEDLHWADEALLAFIEHVLEHAVRVPWLLIATARPELFDRSPTWAAGARNASRINLSPLSEPDTARLIDTLLEQTVLPAEVQAALVLRADGNPLYAQEFARLLKDQAILKRSGATWALDATGEIPIPSEIRSLIAARLDSLLPDRKAMLQDAAVVGKVFWAGALASMGGNDPEEVATELLELSRKQFIDRARRSSMEGESELSFSHALIRDVCYAQIPRASRAERHRRAAEWIEGVTGERVEDHAEILATHYSTALELASAAKDPKANELRAKAIRYLVMSGDRAIGMDVESAERLYAKALQLTPVDHHERPGILGRYAEALLQRGRYHEAATSHQEAIEGFHAQGNILEEASARARHGVSLSRVGDPRQQVAAAEAVAALEPLGHSRELARALTEAAGSAFANTENRHAVGLAERAIAISSELGLPEPARALGFRGGARCLLGDARGLDDLRQALRAASAQGLGREVALFHFLLGDSLWPIEGQRAALQVYREGADFATGHGIEEFVLTLAVEIMDSLIDLGSWDEAMADADDLAARLESAGDVYLLLFLRGSQTKVLARRGDVATAWPFSDWAEQKLKGAPAQLVAFGLPPASAIHLGRGDTTGSRRLLMELEQTRNVRDEPDYAANLPGAVRTALVAGDPELAVRLAEGVEPRYPLHQHALASVRALLAEHRGDHAGAVELYADAADRWGRFEVPWEQAQALLGQGRCLLVMGRSGEASGPLGGAREIFVQLGARPALDDTEALLRRADALTS